MELAILRLKTMLEEAKIPFDYSVQYINEPSETHIIILFGKDGGYLADCAQGSFTCGSEKNLLEILNAVTYEERNFTGMTLGWLTAEEVFKRFKYCYENNTSVYKEEK